ncbi:hypothetical protein O9992_29905 [Vibrio lentus]|nr:hypothetical protein [Vibrio lentus]
MKHFSSQWLPTKAERTVLREKANQEKALGNLDSAADLLKQLSNQSSQEKRD